MDEINLGDSVLDVQRDLHAQVIGIAVYLYSDVSYLLQYEDDALSALEKFKTEWVSKKGLKLLDKGDK